MDIYYGLGFHPSGNAWQKSFKSKASAALFEDYLKRTHYFSITKAGRIPAFPLPKGSQLWVCHTSPDSKMLSSEELAQKIEKVRDSGIRELHILIGGADGFTQEEIKTWSPDFKWKFGPMTLPHELAAVVAAEQIYRAWTILHRLPYHSKH